MVGSILPTCLPTCRRACLLLLPSLLGLIAVLILLFGLLGSCTGARADEDSGGQRWPFYGRDERRSEPRIDAPVGTTTRARVPIPAELHLKNTVGTNNQGNCVPTSVTVAGRYSGVPGIEQIPPLILKRPGAYGPEKLAALLKETVPNEKYLSYVGTDPLVIERLINQGYAVAATMSTGSLYNWQPVHHFVNPIHLDSRTNLACVVDSNQPGVYTWMRADDYKRRSLDEGSLWCFAFLRRRITQVIEHDAALPVAAVVVVCCCLFLLILVALRRPTTDQCLEDEVCDDGCAEGQS